MRNFGLILMATALASCSSYNGTARPARELVSTQTLAAHDYSLADTPNKRTALAYLYTAWNDGKVEEARRTYWAPGSFFGKKPEGPPPPGLPKDFRGPKYTIKKVIEEGRNVVVLAFVEGVGIGEPITTLFGTPGGTKIGDAVVEIFEFGDGGLIVNKWDTIEPLSEQTYDFR